MNAIDRQTRNALAIVLTIVILTAMLAGSIRASAVTVRDALNRRAAESASLDPSLKDLYTR